MIKSTAYKASRFLPTIGIIAYVVLYIIAAKLYPGGSRVYPDTVGFDWTNNYWCHLISNNSINGAPNIAQPIAHAGMVILGVSMGIFFFQFPSYFILKAPWRSIVRVAGITGSFFSMLIMSDYHDFTSVIASVFGALAIVGIFFGLKRRGLIHFIWTGAFCVLLIALNGYVYFTENYVEWLPIIQKVTFAVVLFWMICLNSMFGSDKKLVPMKKSFKRVMKLGKKKA